MSLAAFLQFLLKLTNKKPFSHTQANQEKPSPRGRYRGGLVLALKSFKKKAH
jgi:hypothetical protein